MPSLLCSRCFLFLGSAAKAYRILSCAAWPASSSDRMKFSISLEITISLENFNLNLQNSPPKIGVCQGGTNVHLSNAHFVLRDISALLDPSWGSWLPTLIHFVWKHGEEGRKKAWKRGARRLRPKFWQRTKCTFEKCTFVPSWVWWVARLNNSISLENIDPGGRSWIFSIFGHLGSRAP